MAVQYYEGIGRRKESTARVRLMSGSGKFVVNDKEAAAYFTRLGDMNDILMAFKACGEEAVKYDVTVTVNGGGVSGQTDSVKLGLARALVMINADWTASLRKFGLLTRDARVKERKKPGLKRARKAPTYTKR
jgi:small subunit ribosomal protein S9